MDHRRYLRTFLICLLLLVIAVAGMNFHVDPYGQFGNNRLGIYVSADREAKPRLLEKYPHDGLLLGSSKLALLDPDAISGCRFFNAALFAAVPEEMLYLVENYVRPSDVVLIGFDLYMFNESTFPWRENVFETAGKHLPWYESYFGRHVTSASLKTLMSSFSGKPPQIALNGKSLLNPKDGVGDDPSKILDALRNHHYHDFKYSERRVAVLGKIHQILEERRVSYRVFINPLSPPVLALLATLPAQQAANRLRGDARDIFPALVDLMDGPWSKNEAFFRGDVFHFRPQTGVEFINNAVIGSDPSLTCRQHN